MRRVLILIVAACLGAAVSVREVAAQQPICPGCYICEHAPSCECEWNEEEEVWECTGPPTCSTWCGDGDENDGWTCCEYDLDEGLWCDVYGDPCIGALLFAPDGIVESALGMSEIEMTPCLLRRLIDSPLDVGVIEPPRSIGAVGAPNISVRA